MQDFGKVCYLDVEKTGSTFVVDFLEQNMNLPVKKFMKHGVIKRPELLEDGKIFFITSRDPLSQYMSLYSYGCQGNGRVFKRLKSLGEDQYYDGTKAGFRNWLKFALAPKNAELVGGKYQNTVPRLFGYQTFRFLRLSFFEPMIKMRTFKSREDVVEAYEKQRLHQHVIRNERLNEGLIELIKGPLRQYMKDPEAAIAQLGDRSKKVNTSQLSKETIRLDDDDDALKLLKRREWFLYDVLGYGAKEASGSRSTG